MRRNAAYLFVQCGVLLQGSRDGKLLAWQGRSKQKTESGLNAIVGIAKLGCQLLRCVQHSPGL